MSDSTYSNGSVVAFNGGVNTAAKVSIVKARAYSVPFLTLWIGYGSSTSKEYKIPTANLTEFKHVRYAGNSGNTFSFTMYGPMTLQLEYDIVTAKPASGSTTPQVAFQYEIS